MISCKQQKFHMKNLFTFLNVNSLHYLNCLYTFFSTSSFAFNAFKNKISSYCSAAQPLSNLDLIDVRLMVTLCFHHNHQIYFFFLRKIIINAHYEIYIKYYEKLIVKLN